MFEVGVEKSCRKIPPSVGHTVHHEKRGIAHYIDPSQPFAEFNAVKRGSNIIEEHHVTQMKISMTLSNKPLAFSIAKDLIAVSMFFL